MMNFLSPQLYVGTNLDFPSSAYQGDLFFDMGSQRTYCFSNTWIEIINKPISQKYSRRNCPNCGAPIRIDREYCPYCSTPYLFLEDLT